MDYTKNLSYFPKLDKFDIGLFDLLKVGGGAPATVNYMTQFLYKNFGVQYQVSKEVSNDLILSDFSAETDFDNIPWPAIAVEVYFEDTELPTVIIAKSNREQIQSLVPQLQVESKGQFVYMIAENKDGMTLSLHLSETMWKNALLGKIEPMEEIGLVSQELSKDENELMVNMLKLCVRVFAFASLPQAKESLTRKRMHFGGKAGIKNRPERPAYRCYYLPHAHYETQKIGTHETAEKRIVNYKRGHFRFFKDERFVKMKGKWVYIKPYYRPGFQFDSHSVFKVKKKIG